MLGVVERLQHLGIEQCDNSAFPKLDVALFEGAATSPFPDFRHLFFRLPIVVLDLFDNFVVVI